MKENKIIGAIVYYLGMLLLISLTHSLGEFMLLLFAGGLIIVGQAIKEI